MECEIQRATRIVLTPRVVQMRGMFDVPPGPESAVSWKVRLPLEDRPWSVGLIIGPSGAGKTTVARELFGKSLISGFDWPADRSVLDGFPEAMGIKEVVGLLSAVGFSSPPAWLRPFGVLSTGEQFRVTLARAMAEHRDLAVIDEFTSVVDRTVAQVGSAAIAKTVRATGRKLIAVTCHYDVMDWLQPDWVFEPADGRFAWRSLQPRPPIELDVTRCLLQAWRLFKAHHYLSGNLSSAARCFQATIGGRPAAFAAVVHTPHPKTCTWREHRVVVLPDFQGVGIGNRLSEYVGSVFAATDKPYHAVTGHPAMIHHRLRSPLWQCRRKGGQHSQPGKRTQPLSKALRLLRFLSHAKSCDRITWTFRYVGPPNRADAERFGILKATRPIPNP